MPGTTGGEGISGADVDPGYSGRFDQGPGPDEAADRAVRVRAAATIDGREVGQDLGTLGDIQLAEKPKLTIEIAAGTDPAVVRQVPGEPLEFLIRPGQTISAKVKVTRHDFTAEIGFGKEGAGRNLPYGVLIDNLGLSGLAVVAGQDERNFFLRASLVAQPGSRPFHLRTTVAGGQTSLPVRITVLPP